MAIQIHLTDTDTGESSKAVQAGAEGPLAPSERRPRALLRRGMMATAVLIVIGSRGLAGQSVESRQSFDVASIKPNQPLPFHGNVINTRPGGRFTAMRVTLKRLIQLAYQIQDLQISGGPSWLDSQLYNVEARQSTAAEKLTQDQLRPLLQTLLAERFKLRTHGETRNLQIYSMVVDKNGLKLSQKANPPEPGWNMGPGPGQLQGVMSMAMLANVLGQQLGCIVTDNTGIEWLFDMKLRWAPDEVELSGTSSQPAGPSLLTAVREQLGLRLNAQKGPAKILVIDYAERASEN